MEVGGLEEHFRRVFAHAGFLAAHNAADAVHAVGVGDDGDRWIERISLAVERQDLLVAEQRDIPELGQAVRLIEHRAAVGGLDPGEEPPRPRPDHPGALGLVGEPTGGGEGDPVAGLKAPVRDGRKVVVEDVAFGPHRASGEAVGRRGTLVLQERRREDVARHLGPVEPAGQRHRHLMLRLAQRRPRPGQVADLPEGLVERPQIGEGLERVGDVRPAPVERVPNVQPARGDRVEVDDARRIAEAVDRRGAGVVVVGQPPVQGVPGDVEPDVELELPVGERLVVVGPQGLQLGLGVRRRAVFAP